MGNEQQNKKGKRTATCYFNDPNFLKDGEQLTGFQYNNHTAELTEPVCLELRLESLALINPNGNYQIEVISYKSSKKDSKNSLGKTESKTFGEDKKITFEKEFYVPYYFEKQQLMDIKIFENGKCLTVVETTLGNIMGSLGQLFKKTINESFKLEIKAKRLEKSETILDFNINSISPFSVYYAYAIIAIVFLIFLNQVSFLFRFIFHPN